MLAIHEQLDKDPVRRPRQRTALTQIEGHIVAQQRAVDIVRQQHPPFVFGHAEHLGAFPELELIRFLGIAPCRVAAARDLYVGSGQIVVLAPAVYGYRGLAPIILARYWQAARRPDRDHRQAREGEIEFDHIFGSLAVYILHPVSHGFAEIDTRDTAPLPDPVHICGLIIGQGKSGRKGARPVDQRGRALDRAGYEMFYGIYTACHIRRHARVVARIEPEPLDGRGLGIGIHNPDPIVRPRFAASRQRHDHSEERRCYKYSSHRYDNLLLYRRLRYNI